MPALRALRTLRRRPLLLAIWGRRNGWRGQVHTLGIGWRSGQEQRSDGQPGRNCPDAPW
ncbi:MAG TPA: hypothetical protein VK009_26380 [Chloroflexota bacterium]|nr:hypothetical protein [Chloroflexota bacterium]